MENSFGGFLKQKRQEKNLTQKQLAKLLFVSESAISKWEKGVARPDISLLPKLSEILGVTEHELITASVDNCARIEKLQAKKWRILSFSWNLFFYIAYVVALIPCFICNLAIDKTLSWFFIVLSALILAFTFTNLPKLIKKYKLILIPLSNYLALCLLLGVCCVYTGGNWFLVAILSVFLGLIIVFMPIYIAKYNVFSKIKKYNDFISVAIDFITIDILLVVINAFTVANENSVWWCFNIALPIVTLFYLILNIILCIKFIKINKLLKTSVIIFLCVTILYAIPPFLKVKNPLIQAEINDANVFYANLSVWNLDYIDNNVHLIICLSALLISVAFLTAGLIYHLKKSKKD